MSDASEVNWRQQDTDDQPAVGVCDTGDSDAVAGTILRATERGCHVFVLTANRETETARFAEQLGATVVTHEDRATNGDRVNPLRRSARTQGYPGVIVHEDPTERIDYDKSVQTLWSSDQYTVSSSLESTVDAESVLIGIPAHEEADTIGPVVQEAQAYADNVVVVDDGSTDETAAKARAAGATVIEHDQNKGYGAAVKTAIQQADRSNVARLVILDGDGQHDPGDIHRLVEHQRDTGAEVVIGSRFGTESETDLPVYRRVGLEIVNVLTNLSFGVVRSQSRVRDTQSGFRCYSREAIETLANDNSIGDHMGASTDILHHAHSQNYDIVEVGTTIDYEVEDTSSHNPVYHGITLVMNILRTIENERPVLILGVPGFILAFSGIAFGYMTFSNYITTNTFPVGTAIASVFFTLIGVFAGFTAIILHALQQHLNG